MNEGHSAFLALERIRQLMHDDGLSFETAREASAVGNVFTTHTPVAAGNDWFHPEPAETHLRPMREALGLEPGGVPRAGPHRPQRSPSGLLHDGLSAPPFGQGQRSKPLTRPGQPAHVERHVARF